MPIVEDAVWPTAMLGRSTMPTVLSTPQPASKVSIPLECFLALEQRIQGLRLRILTGAAQLNRELISSKEVNAVLHKMLISPNEFLAASLLPGAPISPSQEAFLNLERRLHNLRIQVVNFAAEHSERRSELSGSDSVCLEPSDIEASWEEFLAHPQMLGSALRPDRDSQ